MQEQPRRVGIVGTGFVSRHFLLALERREDLEVSRVLTRRPLDTCGEFPRPDLLTDARDELLERADVVFECTGDPLYATDTIAAALDVGLPVVTLNAEFHVTAGSDFVGRGLVSEAEGDQPGSEAALKEYVEEMGFEPLVFGNMKGFLNENPTRKEMEYWGERQGLSLAMVTSFTDGTKVQIEQALVANGLGGDIARRGLLGPEMDDLDEAASFLASEAERVGRPISDYVLSRGLPHGVFIVARHDERQQASLEYLKLGKGPYYVLQRPAVLVHLEVARTIERVLRTGKPLLDNSREPRVGVAAVAKRDLEPGDRIPHGIGSFDVRGVAVRIADTPDHMPIGLVQDAVVRRKVNAGDVLSLDDLEIPETAARAAWLATRDRVTATATADAS